MTGRIVGRTSPISWFGGKFYIAKLIIPYFPPHQCYVEPFCGSAQMFFQKTPSPNEVLNDINGELINFFRVLKSDPEWFTYRASHTPASRQLFLEYLHDKELLFCPERAWRFFYLNTLSYSGCDVGTDKKPRCAASALRGRAGVLRNKVDNICAFSERLRDAYIENLPYADCIERYDHESTFFYVDPPYMGYEKAYGNGVFEPDDFERLASTLSNIAGKFILSINDVPLAREVFGRFEMVQIDVKYFANSTSSPKAAHELIFANYPLIKSGQKNLWEE